MFFSHAQNHITLFLFIILLLLQVILKFAVPFWRELIGDANFFGHVPTSSAERGMFGMYYDMSPPVNRTGFPDDDSQKRVFILMTTICGFSLATYYKMSEEEVVTQCIKTLRVMFPDQVVPEPVSYLMTHWGRDPNAMMSYSYVGVGGSGELYDAMAAEEYSGDLFFAGEVSVAIQILKLMVFLNDSFFCRQPIVSFLRPFRVPTSAVSDKRAKLLNTI